METIGYTPPEFIESNDMEVKVARAMEDFSNNVSLLLENLKGQVEIKDFNMDRIAEKVDKIKSGILPILNKSTAFGLDQYKQFANFSLRTNYTAQDVPARKAMFVADVGMTILIRALTDTKEYIENLK